jgi:hypothetical protein
MLLCMTSPPAPDPQDGPTAATAAVPRRRRLHHHQPPSTPQSTRTHLVAGDGGRPQARRHGRRERLGAQQHARAHEHRAAGLEQRQVLLPRAAQVQPRRRPQAQLLAPPPQHARVQRRGQALGHRSGHRRASQAPAQVEHEQRVQRQVHKVGDQRDGQRRAHVRQPPEGALAHGGEQHCRRRQRANLQVAAGQGEELRVRLVQAHQLRRVGGRGGLGRLAAADGLCLQKGAAAPGRGPAPRRPPLPPPPSPAGGGLAASTGLRVQCCCRAAERRSPARPPRPTCSAWSE